MCEAAEALVVKTSAVWTSALAGAGGRPMLSIAVFASTPYAMPSAPSTSCATNPIPSSSANSVVRNICPSLCISFCHALLSAMTLTPHGRCCGVVCSDVQLHPIGLPATAAWRLGRRANIFRAIRHAFQPPQACIVRGDGSEAKKLALTGSYVLALDTHAELRDA